MMRTWTRSTSTTSDCQAKNASVFRTAEHMKKPPLEKTIVNRVILTIRSRGGFAFKLHGSPLQLSGLPDVISCYRGRFVAFEVKRDETKKATPLQDYMMHRI